MSYTPLELNKAAGASEAAIAQTELAAEDACPISQRQADMCGLISKGLSFEEHFSAFSTLLNETEYARRHGDNETVNMNEWWLGIYRQVLHYTYEKKKYEELLASIKEPSVVTEYREVYNKWLEIQAKRPEAVE